MIPQTGELSERVEYRMHGVGCAVEFTDHEVDFDFATDREVGFDAWRLWVYAEQFPEQYPEYQELAAVEGSLAECQSDGTISRVASMYPGESNDNLFRLREGAKLK